MHARRAMTRPFLILLFAALTCGVTPAATAAPWAETGDPVLRHDLQRLSDAGVIDGVLGTWPVPWESVSDALRDSTIEDLDDRNLAQSARRVQAAARDALVDDGNAFELTASASDSPSLLRGYADTPRGKAVGSASYENRSGIFAGRLKVTGVHDAPDDEDSRFDGSFISWRMGNWWAGAGALDRWWGPGNDGSLILSNNARPVPAFFLDRASAEPFDTWLLNWMGPWRFSTFVGQLESEREVPNANLFGMRLAFEPINGVTIGLSRASQFGGKGRSVDAEVIWNMLVGNDNQGGTDEEPGNQLAGYDFRWNLAPLGADAALYGQFIGEDEANGLPRAHMAQVGTETWGNLYGGGSWRLYLEYSDTTASFQSDPPQFNAAYNHGTYRSGYRYYGRAIGHTADGDSRITSLGGLFVLDNDHSIDWVIRNGEINRDSGGRHGITASALDLQGVRVGYSMPYGDWDFGLRVGADRLKAQNIEEDDGFASVTVKYRY
jgi:hypothetical protein